MGNGMSKQDSPSRATGRLAVGNLGAIVSKKTAHVFSKDGIIRPTRDMQQRDKPKLLVEQIEARCRLANDAGMKGNGFWLWQCAEQTCCMHAHPAALLRKRADGFTLFAAQLCWDSCEDLFFSRTVGR